MAICQLYLRYFKDLIIDNISQNNNNNTLVYIDIEQIEINLIGSDNIKVIMLLRYFLNDTSYINNQKINLLQIMFKHLSNLTFVNLHHKSLLIRPNVTFDIEYHYNEININLPQSIHDIKCIMYIEFNQILKEETILTVNTICLDGYSFDYNMGCCVNQNDIETCNAVSVISYFLCGCWVFALINSGGIKNNTLIWSLLRIFQFLNLMTYISFTFPPNLICFLRGFRPLNMGIMLNIIRKICSLFENSTLFFQNQTPALRFQEFGITSNLIDNAGGSLSLLLSLLFLMLLCVMLNKVIFHNNFNLILQRMLYKMQWSAPIRLHQIISLNLIFSCLLQFTAISFSDFINTIGFIFSLLIVLLEIGMILFTLSKIKKSLANDCDLVQYEACFIDYMTERQKDKLIPYFGVLFEIKKIIFSMLIIFIGDTPKIQLILIIILNHTYMHLILKRKIFSDTTSCKVNNISEIIINTGTLFILVYVLFDITNSNVISALSWIFISLCYTVFILNFFFIFGEQLAKITKILSFWMQLGYFIWNFVLAFINCLIFPCSYMFNCIKRRRALMNETKLSGLNLDLTRLQNDSIQV